MRIAMAYISVVFVWATTPLAIKWSSSSLSFHAGVSSRMLLALLLCGLILYVTRTPLVKQKSDWHAFFAGAIGLYPNMLIVYWGAQYIPSGLVSVIFGLYPFMVGVFSFVIFKENVFTPSRVMALLIALLGLALIQSAQLELGTTQAKGMLAIVLSTVFFALSSVWLKAAGGAVEPMRQSTGTLVIATPFFVITWWLFDGNIPTSIDARSLLSVVYLAVAGSVIGGTLFFYVLKVCDMSVVSLITLITPVMALLLGIVLNQERVSIIQWVGCGCIFFALALYQDLLPKCFHHVKIAFQGFK